MIKLNNRNGLLGFLFLVVFVSIMVKIEIN
jgi:hypothetical protein